MILHSKILGEGEPLVILHGFLGMSDNWKTIGTKVSEWGFEVHLVDQRNHGRSFWSEDFDYNLMARDLISYCEHYQLRDINLIGHSMGGKTAMFASLLDPNLIKRLVVVDIAPRFYPVHHQDILRGLSFLDFDIIKSRRDADKVLSLHVPEDGVRMFLLKNLYWEEQGRLGLRINLEVLAEEVDQVGEAIPAGSSFSGETLFIRGDRSEYISDADQQDILRQFPNAQIATISNAGHWVHAENPEEFLNAIKGFVK